MSNKHAFIFTPEQQFTPKKNPNRVFRVLGEFQELGTDREMVVIESLDRFRDRRVLQLALFARNYDLAPEKGI